MTDLKPLICTECGGHIDRDTMTCKFCGIQYKLDESNMPIFVRRFDPKMETIHTAMYVPRYMTESMSTKEGSEYAVKQLANQLSKALIPFMEVHNDFDPRTDSHRIWARVRVYRPDYRFEDDFLGGNT